MIRPLLSKGGETPPNVSLLFVNKKQGGRVTLILNSQSTLHHSLFLRELFPFKQKQVTVT